MISPRFAQPRWSDALTSHRRSDSRQCPHVSNHAAPKRRQVVATLQTAHDPPVRITVGDLAHLIGQPRVIVFDEPQVAEVVSVTEPAGETSPDAGPSEGDRRRDAPRRDGLLARSSWEQARANIDSTPRTVEVLATPNPPPRRAVLSVGTAWNDFELSQ